jgi:glycosyltransferase involved in cell wall biosynthesis
MWRDAKVAVIVPAYQEERIIERMLAKVPAYVDRIYVVDDASKDGTAARVAARGDARVTLVRHSENRGVGAAVSTGYASALADHCDVLAVMAADDQMDPEDLPLLLGPVVAGDADYAKGNRLVHPDVARMPRRRRLGTLVLSALTRRVTALDVDDCQCGFTVLSAAAARRLPLSELWPRYGYPNDLLGMLAEARCQVAEAPVRPVYADEDSGLRPYHMFVIALVIVRRWRRSRARGSEAPATPRAGAITRPTRPDRRPGTASTTR